MKVSDEVFKAIGQLTLRCTDLESIIEIAIWKLVGNKGPIVTSHMNFPHKRDTLLALIHESYPDDTEFHKSLTKELDRALRLLRKRNDLVHSVWSRDEPDTYLVKRARGRFEVKGVQTSAAGIDEATVEILTQTKALIDLFDSHEFWHLSWNDR